MVTHKTVYYLAHPKSGAIRYVGATSSSLAKRLANHIGQARFLKHKCARWVKALLGKGLRPCIVHLVGPTQHWVFHEKRFIEIYRADGKRLLNMTAGGLGAAECFPSAETRDKRSKTLKKRYADDPAQMAVRQALMIQAARSPAARRAASKRMTAIWADPKLAAAMRARMKGSKIRKAA